MAAIPLKYLPTLPRQASDTYTHRCSITSLACACHTQPWQGLFCRKLLHASRINPWCKRNITLWTSATFPQYAWKGHTILRACCMDKAALGNNLSRLHKGQRLKAGNHPAVRKENEILTGTRENRAIWWCQSLLVTTGDRCSVHR